MKGETSFEGNLKCLIGSPAKLVLSLSKNSCPLKLLLKISLTVSVEEEYILSSQFNCLYFSTTSSNISSSILFSCLYELNNSSFSGYFSTDS